MPVETVSVPVAAAMFLGILSLARLAPWAIISPLMMAPLASFNWFLIASFPPVGPVLTVPDPEVKFALPTVVTALGLSKRVTPAVAPLTVSVELGLTPKALLAVVAMTPPVTVVLPLYVLAPPNVTVPVPVLKTLFIVTLCSSTELVADHMPFWLGSPGLMLVNASKTGSPTMRKA